MTIGMAIAGVPPRTAVTAASRHRDDVILRLLRAARNHLGFEIAFVSQLVDGSRVFRYVDCDRDFTDLQAGARDPSEESYCHHVAEGRLPELLVDPALHPVSAALPATESFGVGTHISIPIRLTDGRIFGTFCCFSKSVHGEITERDLESVRMLASVAADYVESLERDEAELRESRARVEWVLADPDSPNIVFQPLVELLTGQVVGVEALSRFPGWFEGPERVFYEAWAAGLGGELEVKAVQQALACLPDLPEGVRLSVNVSPMTLIDRSFLKAVGDVGPGRLVVEVTEHAAVDDYEALRVARAELFHLGIRLAIDDVGMGFSGLNHILESNPDWIKIDANVVRNVHASPVKAAMIESLVSFGSRVDVLVVAEGIESPEEMSALRSLGVSVGQGFWLARPGDLSTALTDL